MSDRKKALIGIRPSVQTKHEPTLEEEKFQNNTLRPILKFQNPILLAVFKDYILNKKIPFEKYTVQQQEAWIGKTLQTDQRLKHKMEGIVLGHFTLEEWGIFQKSPKAYRKRLTSMLIQRLHNQIDYF